MNYKNVEFDCVENRPITEGNIMFTKLNIPATILGVIVGFAAQAVFAVESEMDIAARTYVIEHAKSWLEDPIIVAAINAQNAKNSSMVQSDIDSVDKQWRHESISGKGFLIDEVMSNDLSAYLQNVRKESQGLITEVFVMDAHGLNVGQSDLTSDFWQGDEAKWQKTFLVGPDTLFVDDVELDESTQRYQTQVSYSITDPITKKVIGAVTIGIDAEGLLML